MGERGVNKRRKENIVMSVFLVLAITLIVYGISTTDYSMFYANLRHAFGYYVHFA